MTVLREQARFAGPNLVEAGGRKVRARRYVIATGSRPAIPSVPGLSELDCLTNETVFDLPELPRRLLVLGAGPMGCELAQAFRRLGSDVVMVDQGRSCRARIRSWPRSYAHGCWPRACGCTSMHGWRKRAGPSLILATSRPVAHPSAGGRRPRGHGGRFGARGRRRRHRRQGHQGRRQARTTNARVFAIGDVAGGPQFTHAAGYQAGIVIRNALFRLPARASTRAMPHATFTDPELAAVGLSEARRARRDCATRSCAGRSPTMIGRGRACHQRAVKVVAGRGGRVLGAAIVGARGRADPAWVLAVERGLKLSVLANLVAPYPTLSEASKRAAGAYYGPRLFSSGTLACAAAAAIRMTVMSRRWLPLAALVTAGIAVYASGLHHELGGSSAPP